MRIWLSAEASLDTEEAIRLSSNELEARLNSALRDRDYGSAVNKWATHLYHHVIRRSPVCGDTKVLEETEGG